MFRTEYILRILILMKVTFWTNVVLHQYVDISGIFVMLNNLCYHWTPNVGSEYSSTSTTGSNSKFLLLIISLIVHISVKRQKLVRDMTDKTNLETRNANRSRFETVYYAVWATSSDVSVSCILKSNRSRRQITDIISDNTLTTISESPTHTAISEMAAIIDVESNIPYRHELSLIFRDLLYGFIGVFVLRELLKIFSQVDTICDLFFSFLTKFSEAGAEDFPVK